MGEEKERRKKRRGKKSHAEKARPFIAYESQHFGSHSHKEGGRNRKEKRSDPMKSRQFFFFFSLPPLPALSIRTKYV
jgi:hypothetical protein